MIADGGRQGKVMQGNAGKNRVRLIVAIAVAG